MTQEDKQLLLKDLCARLPYGVKVNHIIYNWEGTAVNFNRKLESFDKEKDNGLCYDVPVEEVRPYLRSMSSMTKEERKEYESFIFTQHHEWDGHGTSTQYVETDDVERYVTWLNAHHFDYRGLIEKGLALEAKEGMYKTE